MSDYINREEFVKVTIERFCKNCDHRKGIKNGKVQVLYEIGEAPCRACLIDDVIDLIENFPASDVEEIKRGKWIVGYSDWMDGIRVARCSECGYEGLYYDKPSYCKKCGAKMEGEA